MNISNVVWAKMRLCSFWPALMMKDPPAEIAKMCKPGQICVLFFGTKKFGFIDASETLIKNYSEFRDKYSAKKTRGLAKAVAKCDEYLADPIKFVDNIAVDLTVGTVSIQKPLLIETKASNSGNNADTNSAPLPIQIKEEPKDDDEFCVSEYVEVTTERNTNQHSNQLDDMPELEENLEYDRTTENIGDMEKRLQAIINREVFKLNESMESLMNRYDQELRDLKELINTNLGVEKHASEILVLAKKLEEKTKKIEKLTEEKQMADEGNIGLSLQHESALKNISDQHANEIADLKKQLNNKKSSYETLLLAKEKDEKDIKFNLAEKHASETLVLAKNVEEKSKQIEELAKAKHTAEEATKALSLQHELLLKKNSDQHANEIADLKKQLNDKKSSYETLLLAKETVEKEIKLNLAEKYASETLVLEKKLEEKSKQIEELAKAKHTAEEATKALSLQHELLLKKYSDQHANEIADLKKQLNDKKSSYETLLLAEEKADKEMAEYTEGNEGISERLVSETQGLDKKLEEKDLSNDTILIKNDTESGMEQKSTEKMSPGVSGLSNKCRHDQPATENLKKDASAVGSSLVLKRKSESVISPVKLKRHRRQVDRFEVERLLEHKTENGERLFLIRWKGYGKGHDSWERESDLSCPNILKQYRKTHKLG